MSMSIFHIQIDEMNFHLSDELSSHCPAQPQLNLKLHLGAEVAILSAWFSQPLTHPSSHPVKYQIDMIEDKIELYIKNKSYYSM